LTGFTWLDGQILNIMSSLPVIQPSNLPIFLTEDLYFATVGEGYHGAVPGATGLQTYIWATYNDLSNQYCGSQGQAPCVSADVAGLSHEVGEWADDPWGSTPSPCGAFLEVADPLNAYPYTPYTVNGFTYHVVDLAFLSWFGAPTSMSFGGQLTFEGENLAVCENSPQG
jgi:hypothetical protein